MLKFKANKTTLAMISSGLIASSIMPVYAAEPDNTTQDIEVIEVKGISRSIIASIDKKRYSDTISEVVDAGDLGTLPDVSIADALGRLPGVTAVRDSGQSSQLNIRGMNGDFIQTTLNGREQASTSGYTAGSRWIAFDQYPSELISQAAVYKSPKASLVEGGVAGTVELKTANPLANKDMHKVTGSVRYSYNDAAGDLGADESGSRLSFSYQGKFLDETLGFGVGMAYLDQPNSGFDVTAHKPSRSQDFNGNGNEERSNEGYQIRSGSGQDERTGIMSTLVYMPNENLTLQFDYFRSEFESEDKRTGINFEGLQRDLTSYDLANAVIADDFLVGGKVTMTGVTGPWFEMRTEDQSTDSTTDSYGFKTEYVTEDWEVKFDVAHSEGTKTRSDMIVSMHAYEYGTDTVGGQQVTTWQELAGQSISFKHNEKDMPDFVFNTDYTDLSHMRMGDFEQFPHEYTDKIDSVKIDFMLNLDNDYFSSIEIGARWSDREFTDKRSTFRWGRREGQNGYMLPDGSVVTNEGCEYNQQNHLCMPHDVTGFTTTRSVHGFEFLDLDLRGIADNVFGAGNYDAQQTWEHNWTLIESGAVEEEVTAAYIMANIDTEIGGIPVTGNIGVRYVETDTKSVGIQNVPADEVGDSIADDNGVIRTDYKHVKYGPEYNDTLPSINLNFHVTDADQIRFAAAKVMGRPPVYQLRGGAGSWSDTANDGVSPRYNVWSKGNPNLDPFRADQYDLSYEHYFEDGGAFSLAFFYKDIESLIESITYQESDFDGDFSWSDIGLEAPDGYVEGQYQTTNNNDNGGYIRGIELAYTTTFANLPGIFSGLGLNANYSYTESETKVSAGGSFDEENLPLPGLSENVWSATVFWDIDDFSTHLNMRYRDEYVFAGVSPGGSSNSIADEYTVMDWQASYDFNNGLQAVLQVNNLTDEPNTTNYGSALATGEYKEFGRQYYLGVNFSY